MPPFFHNYSLRLCALLSAGSLVSYGAANSEVSRLWTDLAAKRARLSSYHQSFDIVSTGSAQGSTRSKKGKVIVDGSHNQWREKVVGAASTHLRIFDGRETFWMEEGADEYVRTRYVKSTEIPVPSPYELGHPDWSQGEQPKSQDCGFSGSPGQCTILRAPLKPGFDDSSYNTIRIIEGFVVVAVEQATGLLIAARSTRLIESKGKTYQSDVAYLLVGMSFGAPADATLFTLPEGGMREVKSTSWTSSRINKQLAGKPAPGLSLIDIRGAPITLTSLKGQTVLLDFWTTWCGPCGRDLPALQRLYQRYVEKGLMIVGVSVFEERRDVESFLEAYPHAFPVALTAEGDLPRPYNVARLPTYVIIDPEGTLVTAVSGVQGYSELKRLLKKGGLNTN